MRFSSSEASCTISGSLTLVRIVSTLVTNQPHLFLGNIAKWLAVAIPATFTNSMLEYLQSELGLAYRTRYALLSLSLPMGPPASASQLMQSASRSMH